VNSTPTNNRVAQKGDTFIIYIISLNLFAALFRESIYKYSENMRAIYY